MRKDEPLTEINSELIRRRQSLEQGGGPRRVEAQHTKGKGTARERIRAFLDPGTFHEIDAYITHRHSDFGLEKKRFPGDSVVVGFGQVNGRRIAVAVL